MTPAHFAANEWTDYQPLEAAPPERAAIPVSAKPVEAREPGSLDLRQLSYSGPGAS